MSTEELSDDLDDVGDVSNTDETDPAELATRIERLVEENRRLREEYARARLIRYRRSAIGLAIIGVIAILGGVAFPDTRAVLFALGATGLFASLLTYYLTPERFLPATVGEEIYRTLATNEVALVTALGLQDDRIYAPVLRADDVGVRLFVPLHAEFDIPGEEALTSLFVVTDDEDERGVSLRPTGGPLFVEFRSALSGALSDDPTVLAEQLVDGLIEQLELVQSATPDVTPSAGRATVGIFGGTFGRVDRFDHPIVSFLAVGFVIGLDRPVSVDVTTGVDDRHEYLVTITWSTSE